MSFFKPIISVLAVSVFISSPSSAQMGHHHIMPPATPPSTPAPAMPPSLPPAQLPPSLPPAPIPPVPVKIELPPEIVDEAPKPPSVSELNKQKDELGDNYKKIGEGTLIH